MRRGFVLCLVPLVLAAGCGGGKKASTTVLPPPSTELEPTTTASTAPTLTSAEDIAACNVLARNLRVVSQMITTSTEIMTTQSVHPKDLARRVGESRKVLLYAARIMELTDVPASLARTRTQFVSSIRSFAADFAKAKAYVSRKDMARAATVMRDQEALNKLAASSRRIEQTCGA